ncbi:MAG: tRNA (adenosine(37)-N6)-dimethylallyltransferase MiaA [Bryobacteraceae bacterium]|jgi:tRNA dimethylallyltransferase
MVAVVGPTGSGKSHLALHLAEAFHGEVVNCDSLQVYRHFDIGTAKLGVGERRGIPHHLIDILEPDALFTAGEFARTGRDAVAGISARGRLPIVCGGTGFYLRALLDGLFAGPARDQALRDRLGTREKRRPGSLHRLLRRLDHAAAAKIHPNDLPKVTRALEVCLLTRRPVTELFEQGRAALTGYRVLKLGLLPDRDALYQRLDVRCARMFAAGLVEEARRILELGFAETVKPFESHGYKQALQLIRGELNPREALFYAQRKTRNYAKRQITWWRKEPGLVWLRGFGEEPHIVEEATARVRAFLGKNPEGVSR